MSSIPVGLQVDLFHFEKIVKFNKTDTQGVKQKIKTENSYKYINLR